MQQGYNPVGNMTALPCVGLGDVYPAMSIEFLSNIKRKRVLVSFKFEFASVPRSMTVSMVFGH
jgi:hypothetical protein